MKLNKPKFHLFKNTTYAINGFFELIKNETSFKIQIFCFILFNIMILFLPITLVSKFILSISLFIPLISEIINSAIERVVDLNTQEYQDLAKYAKDAGATLVLISVIMTLIIWIFTLYLEFI